MFKAVASLAASACLIGSAHGAVIAEHVGGADLVSEGWSIEQTNDGAGITVITGSESGVDYTEIVDTGDALRNYYQGLDEADLAAPTGWTLTARVYVVHSTNSAYGTALSIRDGEHQWSIVFVQNNSTPNASGLYFDDENAQRELIHQMDLGTYNIFQMVYDPTADGGDGAVTVYVNGDAVATRNRSETRTSDLGERVRFGTFNSGASSQSRWTSVVFETGQNVIPEPASLAVLGAGGLMMLRRR